MADAVPVVTEGATVTGGGGGSSSGGTGLNGTPFLSVAPGSLSTNK